MSRRLTPLFLIAAVAAGVAVQGSQAADLPSIYVDYQWNCTFRVTNDAGAPVSQVAPGTYQIVIATPEPFASADLSSTTDLTACKGFVSFRLTGPGVDVFTTLDHGDGAFAIFGVVFQTGASYTLQEDLNVAGTRRTIVASAAASAAASSSSSSSSAAKSTAAKQTGVVEKDIVGSAIRGSLAASVATNGKLALLFKGKPVSELKRGRYTIVVLDETSKSAFKLQQRGKAATTLTTLPYLGRRTVTVSLGRGQWMFYSTPAKKHYFVVTA